MIELKDLMNKLINDNDKVEIILGKRELKVSGVVVLNQL